MPGYRTHLVAGCLVFAGLTAAGKHLPSLRLQGQWLLIAAVLALIGSIFPDIDVPSKMQRLFYYAALVVLLFALLTHNKNLFIGLGLATFVVASLTHRTTTHNVLFIMSAPMAIPLYLAAHHARSTKLAFVLYCYFVVGCLSHVFLDRSITKLKKMTGRLQKRF